MMVTQCSGVVSGHTVQWSLTVTVAQLAGMQCSPALHTEHTLPSFPSTYHSWHHSEHQPLTDLAIFQVGNSQELDICNSCFGLVV